ncbi:formate/nitrite transporter family protein [Aerococcaceae bacterium DSM 111176]|nr:formate/nitrite transporter family protein [Aerococcaceae bacterium DSM 111176]
MNFRELVTGAVHKKENLIDNDLLRYCLRSVYAGAYLTLSTAAGAFMVTRMFPDAPGMAGVIYAFLFAFGLVYILFLGGELATSNMMYTTAGLYFKELKVSKQFKILIICTLFNLIGAFFMAWLFSFMPHFKEMPSDYILANTVNAKLAKPVVNLIVEGIIANVFVNLAILSFMLVKNQVGRIILVLTAVTMFVALGTEHVIANFASFGLVYFSDSGGQFSFISFIIQWFWVWVGNLIGGGIFIGLGYAYLNHPKSKYIESV